MKLLLILATAICCFRPGVSRSGQAACSLRPIRGPLTTAITPAAATVTLKKINQSNVGALTLAWVRRTVVAGPQAGGGN